MIRARFAPEPLATLSGVSHRYGPVLALDRVDLEVRPSEILAVLGPNGAGKTTAISLLLGVLRAREGVAQVFGRHPDHPSVRARRGAMLQISGLLPTLTVAEHLDLFRAYYRTPLPLGRLLRLAGLEDLAGRRFLKLSGGQKQRVMFALAMAGDPELVFLDEPTAGLDLDGRLRLWGEIRALREAGRTAVLTTHYLEEADALADRIVVLHRGRVIATGTPADIKARTAGRLVRAITRISPEAARALPGVVSVRERGRHLELLTSRSEDAVREMLSRDASLTDLTVTGAGLEEAFLSLTGGGESSP